MAGYPSRLCRSCDAGIFMAETPKAKMMPVDIVPDPDGLVVIGDRQLPDGTPIIERIESKGQLSMLMGDEERYTSHFATCPDAEQWRR
jgi:hypothetical protein